MRKGLIRGFHLLKKCVVRHLQRCAIFALCLSLSITPQLVLAANLAIYSNLSKLELDLGNAILRVDRIDSNLSIGLNAAGELTVERFHAKRASLTIKPTPVGNPANSPLPATIRLPMPIALQQGTIDELSIIQPEHTHVLKQIQFNLQANPQTLALALQVMESPWGQLQAAADIMNQKPFALNGWISAKNSYASTPYQLKANLQGDLQQLHVSAKHVYQPDAPDFALAPADMDTALNVILLSADIGLQDAMPVQANIRLQSLDAAHLHPQLNGQLTISLQAEGTLSGSQPMHLRLQAQDSYIQQHPLSLQADATLQEYVLSSLNLNAQLANNTLHLEGGLDANDPARNRLRWQAHWPDLTQLLAGFSGEVESQGEAVHTGEDYQTRYEFFANQLRLPGAIQIQKIQARGKVSSALQAALETEISIQGMQKEAGADTPGQTIDAEASVTGSLAQHAVALSVKHSDATQSRFGLESRIEGGMSAQGWQGYIKTLQSLDQSTLRLKQPVPMRFSQEHGLSLQQMQLHVLDGSVSVETLQYTPAQTIAQGKTVQPSHFSTHGQFNQLPMLALQQQLGLASAHVTQNLTLDGHWNIDIAENINADILLKRANGDITVYDALQQTPHALGLNTLQLQCKINHNLLSASIQVNSQYAGNIAASAETTFTRTKTGFALSQQAPLTLKADANLQHLDWLTMYDASTSIDGQLRLELQGHGSLANPELNGYLRGNQLTILVPSQGIALNNGVLNAEFSQDMLTITQLELAGKSGTLSTQGQAHLFGRTPQLNLRMQADRFTALSRTDRWLVISGTGDIHVENGQAIINGQYKVHNGLIELPKAGKPTLDEDVMVLGRQADEPRNSIALALGTLEIDFGRKPTAPYDEAHHFLLRGQGLNGALSGRIKLSGTLQQLQAFGALEVNGTYLAYGQLLDIETGQINLSGPITNAGLNVVAMRNLEPTKVGVKLTGDIQSPELKLISEPEVSNDDKLSLLVLGRPMSEAGNSELAMLSVAAGALLSQGDSVPLQSKIAGIVGFDSLDVKGTNTTNYSVNIGKRINRQLVIGYEKSLFGLLNVAKLTYQLTRRIAVETKAGSENAVDVVYSFDFD